MQNNENQPSQNPSEDSGATDMTRSQNRQAVSVAQEDNERMGSESEDTGSRPSNSDKNNNGQRQDVSNNQTGTHAEGQYPRNGEGGALAEKNSDEQ